VYAAPPVRVRLGRSIGWIAFVAVCVGAAVASLAAWVLLRNEASAGVAAAAGFLAAAATAWRLRCCETADLHWDGAQWQWKGSGGQAHVALDLDAWMLLHFEPLDGRRCWIAASRKSAVGPWPALRAALYSRRPADPLTP
jgi:hypothetical protein